MLRRGSMLAGAMVVAGGMVASGGRPGVARHAPAARGATSLSTTGPGPSMAADTASSAEPPACREIRTHSSKDAAGLPWPLILRTSCGRYLVYPGGRIDELPVEASPLWSPRVLAGSGWWADVVGGHVVFVHDGLHAWRSAGGDFGAQQLGWATAGPGWVAFTIYQDSGPSHLYLSKLPGAERAIGEYEDPLLATPTGALLVGRWGPDWAEPDIVARDPSPSALDQMPILLTEPASGGWGPTSGPERMLATSVLSLQVEQRRGTVLYQWHGGLWRSDGVSSRRLAGTRWLGRQRFVSITPLADGRIVMQGPDRVEVLTGEGTVWGKAKLDAVPEGGWGYVSMWDPASIDPSTGAITFVATRWNDSGAGGGPGWEGLFRLSPGGSSARLLYGRSLRLAVCAHSAGLSQHGSWILYTACEGRAVAIDSAGRHAPVDVSNLARALPMPRGERAYGLWGADWAPFGSPEQRARMDGLL